MDAAEHYQAGEVALRQAKANTMAGWSAAYAAIATAHFTAAVVLHTQPPTDEQKHQAILDATCGEPGTAPGRLPWPRCGRRLINGVCPAHGEVGS
jgi:hypothetical protein